jgi:hypothetical protein
MPPISGLKVYRVRNYHAIDVAGKKELERKFFKILMLI